MPVTKITLSTAMRARDVSRPRAEDLAEAAAREEAAARPVAPAPPKPAPPPADAQPAEQPPARRRRRRA